MAGTATKPFPRRVLERVRLAPRGEPTECWDWSGYINSVTGYGQVSWQDGPRVGQSGTHRAAWVLANRRPIPDGMSIHHTCYNRKCFNPAHLRLRTPVENSRDNSWRRKTHCAQGHAYDEVNTRFTKEGYRVCRACAHPAGRRVTAAKTLARRSA